MKKINLFLITLFFSFFLPFFSLKVKAENNLNYSITCLKIESTYKPSCVAAYPCLEPPPNFSVLGKKDHLFKLKGTGFPLNEDIYIIGCVETGGNYRCTTGTAENDQKVNQLGFAIVKDPTHEFYVVGGNPVRAASDGSLIINARSYTPTAVNHAFYGVYKIYPETPTTTSGVNSLQYGTFEFNQDSSLCTSVRWDPKGRVFDSLSLEPLPEATIQILDEQKNLLNKPGINSTLVTTETGEFSFYVEPGTYYYNSFKEGYTFPAGNNLNPNYNKIYYCDRDKNNNFPIYNQQYPIVESGKLVHCDVPLDPGTNRPYQSEPKLLKFGSVSLPASSNQPEKTRFSGLVTHPLTTVVLVGKNNRQEIARVTADKFQSWEIIIDNDKIPADEEIEVFLIKPDLTQDTQGLNWKEFFLKKVLAQGLTQISANITFQPILRYIEGYAYDKNGKILPFTRVNLKMQMSDKTIYSTQADEKGFFKIPSEVIPIFSYYLEFIPVNSSSVIKMSTADFSRLNKNYLTNQKLNLMTGTKNNQRITLMMTPPKNYQPTVLPTQPIEKPTTSVSTTSENSAKSLLLIVVILILLMMGVVVGVFIYRKKIFSSNYTNDSSENKLSS
ncbi:MAG: hypothetical protein QHH09_00880 [Microgenomates group bacterium]|nr:hypothetical protein [Microgenomates group bacterium]